MDSLPLNSPEHGRPELTKKAMKWGELKLGMEERMVQSAKTAPLILSQNKPNRIPSQLLPGLNPQIAVVWQIVSGSKEFGLVFYFLSPASRQGVIIEKLMAWKLGSIYPAQLPVNCKSQTNHSFLSGLVSMGKLKILGQVILKVPSSLKNQGFQISVRAKN